MAKRKSQAAAPKWPAQRAEPRTLGEAMSGTRVRYKYRGKPESGIVAAQVPQYGETWVRVDGTPPYANPYLRPNSLDLQAED